MQARLSFLYATHCHDLFYITEVSWLYSKGYSSYRADKTLHLKQSRGNNSESMKARVVILVNDTSSWPVLHNCEVSWLYSTGYSSYRVWKRKLSFSYPTHCHDLFYITVKYHDYIPQGIQVTEHGHEITQKSIKGAITQEVIKRELSFLYATHRHDLFYITVKYHQNIPNGIHVIERT